MSVPLVLPCVSRPALTLSLGLCVAATQAILSMRTELPVTVSLRDYKTYVCVDLHS